MLSVGFCFSTSKSAVYLVRVQHEPSLNCQDTVDSHCHHGGSGWIWVPFPAPTLGSSLPVSLQFQGDLKLLAFAGSCTQVCISTERHMHQTTGSIRPYQGGARHPPAGIQGASTKHFLWLNTDENMLCEEGMPFILLKDTY